MDFSAPGNGLCDGFCGGFFSCLFLRKETDFVTDFETQ